MMPVTKGSKKKKQKKTKAKGHEEKFDQSVGGQLECARQPKPKPGAG
jgi:hypothetical protein